MDRVNPVGSLNPALAAYPSLPVGALTYFDNLTLRRKKHAEQFGKRVVGGDDDPEQPNASEHHETQEPDPIDIEIEEEQLKEESYFFKVQLKLLLRARLNFLYHRYDKAEQDYIQYIRYHDTFGVGFEESLQEYFPAIFEYAFLLTIQDRSDEANEFINLELAQYVSTNLPKHVGDKKPDDLNMVINLQEQEKLPSLGAFKKRYRGADIVKLALHFRDADSPEAAETLLGFVKIRQLIKVFKTDLLINKLPSRENKRGGFHPSDLPLFYNFVGVSNLSDD